jgi:hypothetical protein
MIYLTYMISILNFVFTNAMGWTKLDPICMYFFKKLTYHYFKSSIIICSNWIDRVSFICFFGPIRFTSIQLVSSPLFPLPDVATSLRRVVLPSHEVKMSSLPPLHLLLILHPIASPLEPKLKHWIYTTTFDHPPQTARLSPSTAIKRLFRP